MPRTKNATISDVPSSSRNQPSQSTASPFLLPAGLTYLVGDQLAIYRKIHKRKILATKFFDLEALRMLGLLEPMMALLERTGMDGFAQVNAPTYERYTLEFLCTLNVRQDTESITFRLNNTPRSLTYARLREIFGFSMVGEKHYKPLYSSQISQFWGTITGSYMKSSGNLNSDIPHPCLRLINRVVAMAIFGHGEPTKISQLDMSVLWAFSPEGTVVPDWVHIFLMACKKIQTSSSGKIGLGGMITLIMRHFRLILPSTATPLQSPSTLDLNTLARLKCLARTSRGTFYWLLGTHSTPYLLLPRPHPLPTGPTVRNLFIPQDVNLDLSLIIAWGNQQGRGVQDEGHNDEEEEGGGDDAMEEDVGRGDEGGEVGREERGDVPIRGQRGRSSVEWMRHIESMIQEQERSIHHMQQQLEEVSDRQWMSLGYMQSMDTFYASGMVPGTYQPPVDPHFLAAMERQRHIEERRQQRQNPGGDPGPSSS